MYTDVEMIEPCNVTKIATLMMSSVLWLAVFFGCVICRVTLS